MTDKLFYSIDQMVEMTGFSRSTLWRLEKRGVFPRRHKITAGRSVYLAEDVRRWQEELATAQ